MPAPDANDLIYNTYSINFVGVIKALLAWITGGHGDALLAALGRIWDVYSVIAIILSILFFVGFIYAKIRYEQLIHIENEHLREAEEAWAHTYGGQTSKNSKWDSIQKHITSDSPTDWRLAIIDADILLDEALTNAGYVGATIGDKLKTVNVTSFQSVQDAWDAHKVRNDIAHAGTDFVLTKRLAQETIVKYERVFREFGVI